jgi:hypothetical protein
MLCALSQSHCVSIIPKLKLFNRHYYKQIYRFFIRDIVTFLFHIRLHRQVRLSALKRIIFFKVSSLIAYFPFVREEIRIRRPRSPDQAALKMEGTRSSLIPLYQKLQDIYIPEGCDTENRVIPFTDNVNKTKLATRFVPPSTAV